MQRRINYSLLVDAIINLLHKALSVTPGNSIFHFSSALLLSSLHYLAGKHCSTSESGQLVN